MNRPTFDDLNRALESQNYRLALIEIAQNAIQERLDILEAAWEKLVDKIDAVDGSQDGLREKVREDFEKTMSNIYTLRDDILTMKGERLAGVAETEQELLDELPEFDSVEEIEKYAKAELAKGSRAETIQRWIDDPDSYRQENDNE